MVKIVVALIENYALTKQNGANPDGRITHWVRELQG